MNTLLEKAKFVDDEYCRNIESFFSRFMNDRELFHFFERVFLNDESDRIPRKMTNQIVRWVSLAEDLQKIRPGRDPLTILCIRACIESICLYDGSKDDKTVFFEKNMSKDSLEYINRNFEIILIENEKTGEEIIDYETLVHRFDEMIFAIRNEAVHDGDYWSSQVFARKNDRGFASCYRIENKEEKRWECIRYGTTIDYQTFIKLFVETSIRYIDKYIYKIWGENVNNSEMNRG